MNGPKPERYKLSPSVFYRIYDDTVVVYDTQAQKVYTFNEIVGDILPCFEDYATVGEAVSRMLEIYEIGDTEEFSADIGQFIAELAGKGLLNSQYKQYERLDDLEKQVYAQCAKNGQLCSATIELTYHCNERCRHCYIVNDRREELSTEKVKSIIDELAEMHVLNLVFTGGEIFTRPDTFEILEYAYAKHFVVDILTNGNLLEGNDFIRLKRIYPRCIHFSLYSHQPEKHDAVTRIKGSFEKTMRAVRACISIGIPVNLKTPVFAETMGDVPGIAALANELGCTVEFSSNITPKKNGDLTPLEMEIKTQADNEAVIGMISGLISAADNEPGREAPPDRNCGAGDNIISINPYGEVFPCNLMPLCIGNVYEQTIREIWENSQKLNWWRKNNRRQLRKGCESCEIAEKCRYCPGEAMMWTGDPLSKYEAACLTTKAQISQREKSK